MARQRNQTARAISTPAAPGLEHLAYFNTAPIERLMQSGNAMMNSIGEFNAEILTFATKRLDARIALGQSLSKCNTIAAAVDAQVDFACSALQVYLDEASKVMALATQTGKKTAKRPQRAH